MINKYNFEDHILLVGTNPLPNYIVAKYFLMNNQNLKKIWLVHSEKQNDDAGTKEVAERIKDVIQKEHPKMNFDYCPLADISNARTIKNTVERIILPKIDSMHFNYTGGTKSMAVHVYRAIERAKNIRDRSFSYLDAREFRLKDDMDGFKIDDLRKSIKISFETLIVSFPSFKFFTVHFRKFFIFNHIKNLYQHPGLAIKSTELPVNLYSLVFSNHYVHSF